MDTNTQIYELLWLRLGRTRFRLPSGINYRIPAPYGLSHGFFSLYYTIKKEEYGKKKGFY
jgi:hypothetical protein